MRVQWFGSRFVSILLSYPNLQDRLHASIYFVCCVLTYRIISAAVSLLYPFSKKGRACWRNFSTSHNDTFENVTIQNSKFSHPKELLCRRNSQNTSEIFKFSCQPHQNSFLTSFCHILRFEAHFATMPLRFLKFEVGLSARITDASTTAESGSYPVNPPVKGHRIFL